MRLFIGLDVPYEMSRNLELLLQLLKPAAHIQWSPMTNLHITTKFIGEWPEDQLPQLKSALQQIPRPGALDIAIRGIGWFPNPHQPRILYAGIQAPPALAQLAAASDAACQTLGIEAEHKADHKPFTPHLTLARIKSPEDLFPLKKAIAGLPNADFGAFTAHQFHLYQSRPTPSGSLYTKLATYPLEAS
jgi:2'-5' RNA ligase